MSQSRFGKQIEICRRIKSMNNESQIIAFLQVWSQQSNCNNVQHLLSKLFISTKCKLSDAANNVILRSFDRIKEKHKKVSRIESLPKDIFNGLASFLTVYSNLNLSVCNHTIHKMVHNDDYFGQCIDNQQFVLTPRKLTSILTNNSHLFCFLKECNVFVLSSDKVTVTNNNDNIHSYDWTCDDNEYNGKCVFCRLIEAVDSQKRYNYALSWFTKLLTNIKKIVIGNNLVCVVNNLPMEWLFNVNNNSCIDISALETEHAQTKGLKYAYESQLRKESTEIFCNKYNDYISKNKNNNINIRQINRLRLNVEMNTPYFELLSKLHFNYNELTIDIANTRLHCESMDDFANVFHANVNCLTLKCANVKNDSNEIVDITNTFFKQLSNVYNEFSIHTIANNVQHRNINIDIKTLKICESVMKRTHEYNNCRLNGLLSFLNNVKLIDLLNIHKSVKNIQLTLFNFNSFQNEYINDIIFNHIGKFKNVQHVTIRLILNFRRRGRVPMLVFKIKSFYQLFWKFLKQKYIMSNIICTNNVKIEFLWFASINRFKKWREFDGINYVHYSTQKCKIQIMKFEQLKYDILLFKKRYQTTIGNVKQMFWHDWDNEKYELKLEKEISQMNYWKHSFNLQHNGCDFNST